MGVTATLLSEVACAPTALRCRGVTVRRGGRSILSDVSVAVRPGELLALVGPNGAGKSTLLGVLAGDLVADAGEVFVSEEPIRGMKASSLALLRSVLPQRVTVEFGFTAREIVDMGRAPHRRSQDDAAIVNAAMSATDTSAFAARIFRSLSGGEQTRVVLARVLAQQTPIVLLDEPTAALDLRHQESVMVIARRLAHAGHTVVAVLHDLNLAAAYADRIAVLADGILCAEGSPQTVLTADLIEATYGTPVHVTTHPVRGCPLVVPSGVVPAVPN